MSEEKKFAQTSWCAEDVTDLADQKGMIMTEEWANELLAKNQNHIVDRMVAAGWEVLDYLLDEEKAKWQ